MVGVDISEEKRVEFEEKAKALMQWLCENGHPHMMVVVTPTTAELVEGVLSVCTSAFVRD